MKLAYNVVMRCVYCGSEVDEPWRSCCGEVHQEAVPECPECGEDLALVSCEVTGIETHYMACSNCEWRGEPE